jgi:oligopeptide transport system permease protein
MTDLSTTSLPEAELTTGRSLFQLALIRFRRNRAAMAGCVMMALIAFFAFVGPLFTPHRYDQVFSSYVTIPPSLQARPDEAALRGAMEGVAGRARVKLDSFVVSGQSFTATISADSPIDPRATRYFDRANEFKETKVVDSQNDGNVLNVAGQLNREYFLFGTDPNGRDLLARVMLGGRVDNVMMRLVEILYSLPFVFLVVVLVVFFGRSFILIFLVIGAVEWLDMARIVRGQTLALKRREFVGAAQSLGLTDWQIIRRHIIPNTIGPVIVFVTVVVPKVILLESFLSFLGLGVQAPLTSWGALISEGANNIQSAPWLLIFPSIFFVATLFSLNFIGDGLRDALDPRDR